MKRSELFFSAIFVPLDYAALILAGIVSYQIRYLKPIKSIRPVAFDLHFSEYIELVFSFFPGLDIDICSSGALRN